MKLILYIHSVLEVVAGFILLFNPELLLSNNDPNIQGLALAKLYGIAIFTFGIITYILSKHFVYSQMYKQIILCIIAFHFVVGLHMYGVYHQQVTPHIGASILHLSLAILFILMYLRNLKLFL
ncbi:MAG: hypothetical protein IPO92_09415 [Saprospiraceae bacterium]|nr:hypothetical protein [Saprospiraceae bacterium]